MFRKTIVFTVIVCLLGSVAFAMPVPSEGGPDSHTQADPCTGSGKMTDQELILVIVGAVLGTIILLAILN